MFNRHPKQNWFESPVIKTSGLSFFHNDQKIDLFNIMKNTINQRTTYLTPNNNFNKLAENGFLFNANGIKDNNKGISPYAQYYNNNNSFIVGNNSTNSNINGNNNNNNSSTINNDYSYKNKFQDVNLPNMFNHVKIQIQNEKQKEQKQKIVQKPTLLIQKKLNFDDSNVIQEQDDYCTPEHKSISYDSNFGKPKKQMPVTTAKKSSNFTYFQEQKKTRPKEKGLRILSQKAYQIVLKLNGATYKQVATVLVQQLAVQDGIELNGKDQQNIKRRVYDALNVLIALGILRKDQRKIYGVPSSQLENMKTIKKALIQKIELEKIIMKDKFIELEKAKIRQSAIKALIKRNRLNKTQIKQQFNFPFIAVPITNLNQSTIKFKVSKQSVQINASSDKQIHPFGDMDAVTCLKDVLKPFTQ